nr:phospholipase SGR2 [Ipomoea batatas]
MFAEPAAVVPHTEIVGHGDYFRFGMRDSLAIEALFLQREEELLSLWWKEYAECSEGPSELPSKLNSTSIESSPVNTESSEQDAVEEERVGVPVKGGLYEVIVIVLLATSEDLIKFASDLPIASISR